MRHDMWHCALSHQLYCALQHQHCCRSLGEGQDRVEIFDHLERLGGSAQHVDDALSAYVLDVKARAVVWRLQPDHVKVNHIPNQIPPPRCAVQVKPPLEACSIHETLGEGASRLLLYLPRCQGCLQELLGVRAAEDVDLVDLLEAACPPVPPPDITASPRVAAGAE